MGAILFLLTMVHTAFITKTSILFTKHPFAILVTTQIDTTFRTKSIFTHHTNQCTLHAYIFNSTLLIILAFIKTQKTRRFLTHQALTMPASIQVLTVFTVSAFMNGTQNLALIFFFPNLLIFLLLQLKGLLLQLVLLL